MVKKIIYLISFVILSVNVQAETSTKSVLIMDRHEFYINQIARVLFDMDNITMYTEITPPDWSKHYLLKKIHPHLIILHISCFLDPQKPEGQDYYQKLIALLDFMEPSRTKFLFYSSSSYYRKEKIVKAQVTQFENSVPKLKGQNRIFVFQDPVDEKGYMDLEHKKTEFAFKRLIKRLLR